MPSREKREDRGEKREGGRGKREEGRGKREERREKMEDLSCRPQSSQLSTSVVDSELSTTEDDRLRSGTSTTEDDRLRANLSSSVVVRICRPQLVDPERRTGARRPDLDDSYTNWARMALSPRRGEQLFLIRVTVVNFRFKPPPVPPPVPPHAPTPSDSPVSSHFVTSVFILYLYTYYIYIYLSILYISISIYLFYIYLLYPILLYPILLLITPHTPRGRRIF